MEDIKEPELTQRQIAEREKKTRILACQAELEVLLEKHGCTFEIAMLLKADKILPQLAIVSKI